MGIGAESKKAAGGIGEMFGSLRESAAGLFEKVHPDVKAARAETANTVTAARAEVQVAQAQAQAQAIKEAAAKSVEAIKAPKVAAEAVQKSGVLSKLFWLPKQSAKAALKIVEVPFTLGMKGVNIGINGAKGVVIKAPGKALAGTAIVAAVAAGSWFAKRGTQNLQAQSDAIHQMQMAQAMEQPRYMNNPEASQAFVDARMAADRDHGVAGASNSRAEAVMAARQQAPTATADVAAL